MWNFDHKQPVPAICLSCWPDNCVSNVTRQAGTPSYKVGLMCACSDLDDTDIVSQPSQNSNTCVSVRNHSGICKNVRKKMLMVTCKFGSKQSQMICWDGNAWAKIYASSKRFHIAPSIVWFSLIQFCPFGGGAPVWICWSFRSPPTHTRFLTQGDPVFRKLYRCLCIPRTLKDLKTLLTGFIVFYVPMFLCDVTVKLVVFFFCHEWMSYSWMNMNVISKLSLEIIIMIYHNRFALWASGQH